MSATRPPADRQPVYTHVVHEFDPVFDERSRVLVLGSVPSVKSRENRFYYGNPQNRFWKVLAAVVGDDCQAIPEPQTIDQKVALLLAARVALWDVVAECDIVGSSDASIRNVVPVDLSRVFSVCDIRAVFCNGATSGRLYARYLEPITGRPASVLPSTSPANAGFSLDRLIDAWRVIRS